MSKVFTGPPKANAQKPKRRKGNQKPRLDYYRNGDIWLADKTIRL